MLLSFVSSNILLKLSKSLTLEGHFELTWRSKRALILASCIVFRILEIQGHRMLSSRKTDVSLECVSVLVKHAVFFVEKFFKTVF